MTKSNRVEDRKDWVAARVDLACYQPLFMDPNDPALQEYLLKTTFVTLRLRKRHVGAGKVGDVVPRSSCQPKGRPCLLHEARKN